MLTAMKYTVWAIDARLNKRVFFYGNDQQSLEMLVASLARNEHYSEIEFREADTGKPILWRDRVSA